MSLKKENVEWLLALAYVFIQTNKPSRAMAILNAVLIENQDNPDAMKLSSIAFFKKEEFDKAFGFIKKWMALSGTSREERIEMYLLQARVLLRLKRKDLAKKCLLKYTELIDEEEAEFKEFMALGFVHKKN